MKQVVRDLLSAILSSLTGWLARKLRKSDRKIGS